MIASLDGTVTAISHGQTVIEVQSIGYLVNTTIRTSASLSISQKVKFHTSLVVREDSVTLYGFTDFDELEYFDLLRSVNGVGPKSALAILGELSVEQISEAVMNESDSVFKAVSGIGVKTAKLIVLTLAGKISSSSKSASSNETEAAVSALITLGWSEKQSRDAVTQVATKSMSEKELLKTALQKLSKARKA